MGCDTLHSSSRVLLSFNYMLVSLSFLVMDFVGVPIGERLCIGVRFGHKIFGLNLTQCVSDIWNE